MPYNVQRLWNAPKRPNSVHPPALTPGRSPSIFSTVAHQGSTGARRTSTDAEKHQSALAVTNPTSDAGYLHDVPLDSVSHHPHPSTASKGKQAVRPFVDSPPPVPPKLDFPYPVPGGSGSGQGGRRSLPVPPAAPSAWGSSSNRMSGPVRSASVGGTDSLNSVNHSEPDEREVEVGREQTQVPWINEPPDYKAAWDGRA